MTDPANQRMNCPACNKGYRWHASIAGRTVPCKQCGESFVVPDEPGTGLPAKPTKADGAYEIQTVEAEEPIVTPPKCPSCNTSLRKGAVICMNCGFNLKEGKKMGGPEVTQLNPKERKEAGQELRGMKYVRIGLWLNMLSVLLMFGMIPLPIAGNVVGFDYFVVLSIVSYLVLGASTAGSFLCLSAPKESRAKPVLIVSVVLSLVSTVMLLMIDIGGADENLHWGVDIVSFFATALFLYFFVKLAEYLDFDEIIENARKVLGLYITINLGAYLLLVPLPCLGCAIAIGVIIMAIYTLFLYIALLIDLNNALTYRIGEQSD